MSQERSQMNRVIDEMSKAKSDVERRMRLRIPEIIEECKRFAWLGKMFSFDYDQELDKKVNAILISLSDDIMEDIEARAKRVIREAEMEDEEDAIFAYMKREINEEDLTERLDKHCSTLRHFLEGWIAIGFAESISKQDLVSDIFAYMDNPYASPLWQSAYGNGYASNAVKSQNYSFGKGNLRNPLKALFLVAETAINTAFQYGKVLFFRMKGAIGYRTHRNSSFDCPYCDELTRRIHPLTDIVLPAHPRCVCFATPVYMNEMYPEDIWEHTYKDPNTGGYVVTERTRIKDSLKSPNEREKYAVEKRMNIVLAKNSFRIEHRHENSGVSSCDIMLNEIPADLKSVSSHNNIAKRYKKAVRQQGAKAVVFEFTKKTEMIKRELLNYNGSEIPLYYYYLGEDIVRKA